MRLRLRSFGTGLAALALLAFLLQTLHFAAVVHQQGKDGRLYHLHAGDEVLCHHHAAGGDQDRPGDDEPGDDEPDEGDSSCPLHPPGLDRCDQDDAPLLRSLPPAEPAAGPTPRRPVVGFPPLSLAPKQSPPRPGRA